jgi:hypothetical protein
MDLVFHCAKSCTIGLSCVLQPHIHILLTSFGGSCKETRWRKFVPYGTPNTIYGIVELRIVDVQFIRIDSHDRPVYFVQPVGFKHELATRAFEDVEVELVPSCRCSQFGAGEFGKRMKVETIDDKANAIQDKEHMKSDQ